MRKIALFLIACSVIAGGSAYAQSREEQALQNYQRIQTGQLRLTDLSPQEQADVAEIDRQIQAQEIDERTPEQRCYDEELAKLGPEPTYLARRSTALKCGITLDEAEGGRAE